MNEEDSQIENLENNTVEPKILSSENSGNCQEVIKRDYQEVIRDYRPETVIINTGNYNEKVKIDYQEDNRSINVNRLEPSDKALERLHEAAKLNLEQLEKNYNQVRKESSRFFWLMLGSSGLGFTVIIFSVVLLCFGRVTAGIVGTVASTIPNATSFLFFRKENELRKSIEKYHRYLIESHKTSSMIDVAETITNLENKDHIKRTIIYKVLDVNNQEFNSHLQEVAIMEEKLLQIRNNSDN